MAYRNERARIAAETVEISQRGEYIAASGKQIDISDAVRAAAEGTRLITPDDWTAVRARAEPVVAARRFTTTFEVQNESTFSAARRLVERFGSEKVAALNFASAKHPGGGFLGGAQAQEESLARASALHPCLLRQPEYYAANQRARNLLYTDHLIFSPQVPVFRDEREEMLEEPWQVTIITSPAPNAGAIRQNEPETVADIEPTFRRRIEQVLTVAAAFERTALVLGAWGCGVFRNDPAMVANLFAEFLLRSGRFSRAFEHIAFAILDPRGNTIAPFQNTFCPTD